MINKERNEDKIILSVPLGERRKKAKNRKIFSLLHELNNQLLLAQKNNDEAKIIELQFQIQQLNVIKKSLAENLGFRTILP